MTFTLPNGTIKANPVCRVAENAQKQLLTVQKELGLTQAARERQKIKPLDGTSDDWTTNFLNSNRRRL